MTKNPPKIKIYEALSAIASNKVKIKDSIAYVTSSNNEKEYVVKWKEKWYSSNDNASIWQGYLGYPILAVLLIQGKLNYSKEILTYFKNINWHELNLQYKRNYDQAITSFLEQFNEETKKKIEEEVEKIYQEVLTLDIELKRKI